MLTLSAPLALASVLTPLLGLVETGVAGHLPGAHGMAAVALGAMLFNLMFWAFAFLRIGTTGVVAQAAGEGRWDEVRVSLLRGLLLALVFGVALIALGQLLLALALRLIDASPEVEHLATVYVHRRLLGMPAALAGYVLLGFTMGMARSGVTMQLEMSRGAINIALLSFMAQTTGGSVHGIATASAAADWLSLAVSLAVAARLLRGFPGGTPALRQVLEPVALRRVLVLNTDLFIRTQCLLVVLAFFTAFGAQLGDVVLATNSALINTFWLFTYGVGAFAAVASSLMGRAVGARDHVALVSAMRVTTVCAVLASAVSSLVLGAFGPNIVAALTESAAVQDLARVYLPYVVALPLIAVLSLQLDGLAVGAGQLSLLRNTFVLAAAGSLFVLWIAVPALGNHGVWLGFVAFMGLRSVGFYFSYRHLVTTLPAPMMRTSLP